MTQFTAAPSVILTESVAAFNMSVPAERRFSRGVGATAVKTSPKALQ
jgi:hypothetical protein